MYSYRDKTRHVQGIGTVNPRHTTFHGTHRGDLHKQGKGPHENGQALQVGGDDDGETHIFCRGGNGYVVTVDTGSDLTAGPCTPGIPRIEPLGAPEVFQTIHGASVN